MKMILTILLYICNIWLDGQCVVLVKYSVQEEQRYIKTNNIEDSLINGADRRKKDTNNLILDSNGELIVPTNTGMPTKIILAKEGSSFDFFKYLFPIFTLLLGIWIKELLDRSNNKKKIKKMGQRWVAELRSIEEPLRKQNEALKEFLIEHKKENFSIPRIILYSSLNGEVFKSLDKNELIQYIELNLKKSDYKEIVKISNKTHGYISVLANLHSTLKDKFEKYLSQTSIHVEAFNKSLQSFNVAFAEYGTEIEKELGVDPIHDERYRPIADLYSIFILPHLEDGKFNPFVLQTDFFFPIVSHLSKYRLEPNTKPLLVASNEALNNIKGIRMEKHYMAEIVSAMLDKYDDLLGKLDDIVNAMDKQ